MIRKTINVFLRDPRLEKYKDAIVKVLRKRLGDKFYILKQVILQQANLYAVKSPKANEHAYQGYIAFANGSTIKGWAVSNDKKLIESYALKVNGNNIEFHFKKVFRADVARKYDCSGEVAFEIYFNCDSYKPCDYHFELIDAQTNTTVFSSNVIVNVFNKNTHQYHSYNYSVDSKAVIDVVVPVYDGLDETCACIDSVLKAEVKQNYKLILIDDRCPNNKLSAALKRYANDYEHVELVVNSENLGFVLSVNKGMLFSQNDVVLLNADTVVSNGWLDKLVNNAYLSNDIGTVTPLSNNATIFSFPASCPIQDLPEPESIEVINTLLEKHNHQTIVDVPTAHGFCMYIKRELLNRIGTFDAKTWGKGYGEENDFSVKAELAGYRNVAAGDTYVKHVGSVSFGDSSTERVKTNLKKLDKLYPQYLPSVGEFLEQDPLLSLRQAPAQELFLQQRQKAKFSVLHICHSLGGGTEYAMRSLMEQSELQAQTYALISSKEGKWWRIENQTQSLVIEFDVLTQWQQLLSFLQSLNINHLHYHQLLEFDHRIALLPTELAITYDFALHDFYMMCPRVNMLQPGAVQCEGPSKQACNDCLSTYGPHAGSYLMKSDFGDVTNWWQHNLNWLEGARRVIAPSKDVSTRFQHFYQLKNIIIKAHPEPVLSRKLVVSSGTTIKVAVIGAIGEHKGIAKFIELLEYCKNNRLPIEFVLFGFGSQKVSPKKYPNLTVTGQYAIEDLPSLVTKSHCDRALFLSVWPETFSYTLSEAWQLGLYPIAFDLGAFVDRIPDTGIGKLMPYSASIEKICEYIMKADLPTSEYTIGKKYIDFITDYYELSIK